MCMNCTKNNLRDVRARVEGAMMIVSEERKRNDDLLTLKYIQASLALALAEIEDTLDERIRTYATHLHVDGKCESCGKVECQTPKSCAIKMWAKNHGYSIDTLGI